MTLSRFINALKIMRFIEQDDLEKAGVSTWRSAKFLNDPYLTLITASDEDPVSCSNEHQAGIARDGAGFGGTHYLSGW